MQLLTGKARKPGHDPAAPAEYHSTLHGRRAPYDESAYPTLVFPGLAGADFSFMTSPNHVPGYTLADAGLPVASAQYGAVPLWGNDTALDRMEALIAWAETDLRVDVSRIGLIGQSKGGPSVLNFAYLRRLVSELAWIALCVPSTDLDAIMALDPLTEAQVQGCYGGVDPPDDHNPIKHAEYYADIPVHIWAAQNDPVITVASIDAFAARAECGVTWLGNVGHVDFGGIPADELVDFARENS